MTNQAVDQVEFLIGLLESKTFTSSQLACARTALVAPFQSRNSFELLAAAITEVVRETDVGGWRDKRDMVLAYVSDEDFEEFLSWFEKEPK